MREVSGGEDQLLVDPSDKGEGIHTAVKPLRVSGDGRLLLYEIKQGGERAGSFGLVDVGNRIILPDSLPRGYLRGFAFAGDGKSFLYIYEGLQSERAFHRAAYRDVLGTSFREDQEIFCAGEATDLRLGLIADTKRVGFLVQRFGDKTRTDFYLKRFDDEEAPERIVADADCRFVPVLVGDRVFALTDRDAPNLRIVELRLQPHSHPEWVDLIPQREARIHQWFISGDHILVSYVRGAKTQILVFDFDRRQVGEIASPRGKIIRTASRSPEIDQAFLETESFTEPIAITRYCPVTGRQTSWSRRIVSFETTNLIDTRVCYRSTDGTSIPMFLVGRRDVITGGSHPAIMTSYGGGWWWNDPPFSFFFPFPICPGGLFFCSVIPGSLG